MSRSASGVLAKRFWTREPRPHGCNQIEGWRGPGKIYIINEYIPKATDRERLIDTLKTAVYLARSTRLERLGDTALDAVTEMMVWHKGFQPLEAGKKCDGKAGG